MPAGFFGGFVSLRLTTNHFGQAVGSILEVLGSSLEARAKKTLKNVEPKAIKNKVNNIENERFRRPVWELF